MVVILERFPVMRSRVRRFFKTGCFAVKGRPFWWEVKVGWTERAAF
jgi:hypothetical protein